ncbi:PREDICTED: nascent polypeptide-associated complex subunit alpha-like protein 1 [Drosophila arizonae]|uniref:Nascent polypeptide-associated complex subunit alpha-like protein 1 n=1 Tax=Drosophila arizonae TaxID=7263 RepID=A0ABM1NVK3_DROAR|nr:PREDICTED: nascent polypeptide-associated complex subunit alpha-like protein 1 [Drosophila arizonae]
MGKKQKMKKAAAAAAAAAAKAAAGDAAKREHKNHGCCSGSGSGGAGCCVKDKCTDSSNLKPHLSSVNMQNLMTLAENLQASPSGKCKSQESSGSGSSASDSSDSDDAPDSLPGEAGGAAGGRELQQQKQSPDGPPEICAIPKYSRGEKKARRLLMKLDLVPVPNVSRVTMRKAKNVLLCIDQPEVFKCPNSKTLICFGEVRIENASNAAAAQAAERYINDVNVRTPQMQKDGSDDLLEAPEGEEVDIEALGSALDEKDIELVQMQAGCTRSTAIKALIKHKSDVVNAIMELTVGVDI